MNSDTGSPVVAVHDVRDLAFAVEARPRADELQPRVRGFAGSCIVQPNPAAIELSTAAASSCVPSTPFIAKHFT